MTRVGRAMLVLCLAASACGEALARDRAPEPAEPPTATEVRLTGDQTRTRIVFDLDRPVEAAVFALADPNRVVVDLPEVAFRLAANTGRDGRGLVAAFRFGQFAPGRSRIVIDLKEPALVERHEVRAAERGQPARLVVELARASREEFQRAVQRDARPPESPAARPAAAPRAGAERRARLELPLVVLDPGHGGIDAGASASDGQHEKNLVLDFARALRTALERTGRVRVALTRDSDVFLRLDDRVRFARERQAALFLSIHADSMARPLLGVSGASVYTLSERASDREAAAYAERENRADAIAGVEQPPENEEVADILFDLMHRETKNFSVHFARLVVEQMRAHVRMVRNPHRFAGFRVLRAPDVPSALIELGYLSSRSDVQQLSDPEWRRRAAESVARAVTTFLDASQARLPEAPPAASAERAAR